MTRNLLHLNKRILISLSIPLLFSMALLTAKISLSEENSQVIGQRKIAAQFSPIFADEILTKTFTVTAGEFYKRDFSFDEIGLSVIKIPNAFERIFTKNDLIVFNLNQSKFEGVIQNISNENYREMVEEKVEMSDGKVRKLDGETGFIIITNTANDKLIEALENQKIILDLDIKVLEPETLGVETFYLNDRLNKIEDSNFWIRYRMFTARINGRTIREITTLDKNKLRLKVNADEVEKILKEKLTQQEVVSEISLENWGYQNFTAIDSYPDYQDATHKIEKLINDGPIQIHNMVDIGSIIVPATKGDYTDKYVEIDLSQQLMYVWENNKLQRTYTISSGARNLTPIGIFKIINKSENAWSPIYKKWMPYWMAFTYLYEYEGWAGFHELTYWYDEFGNKVFEADDRIGTAVSGGCVRLARGEAKEFYDWARVGDDVLIHE